MKTQKKNAGKHKAWSPKEKKFVSKSSPIEPEWTKIGVVGVDSGTLMVGDPCYLDDDGWTEKDYDKYVCEMAGNHGQVPFEMGHAGKAVVFSSGFGDGCYEVFAKIKDCKDWGKRVAEVRIVMIREDEV